jgi:hypothetical protein
MASSASMAAPDPEVASNGSTSASEGSQADIPTMKVISTAMELSFFTE